MAINQQLLAQALAKRAKSPLDLNSSLAPGNPSRSIPPGTSDVSLGANNQMQLPPELQNMPLPDGDGLQIDIPQGSKDAVKHGPGEDIKAQVVIDPDKEAMDGGPASGGPNHNPPGDVSTVDPVDPSMMSALGADKLSDSDKANLMGGKPSSLTGKVRQAMLMAKNKPNSAMSQ